MLHDLITSKTRLQLLVKFFETLLLGADFLLFLLALLAYLAQLLVVGTEDRRAEKQRAGQKADASQ